MYEDLCERMILLKPSPKIHHWLDSETFHNNVARRIFCIAGVHDKKHPISCILDYDVQHSLSPSPHYKTLNEIFKSIL